MSKREDKFTYSSSFKQATSIGTRPPLLKYTVAHCYRICYVDTHLINWSIGGFFPFERIFLFIVCDESLWICCVYTNLIV